MTPPNRLCRADSVSPLRGGARSATRGWVMETKWLEDFVSLAETRSFSRSAQLRHVTQPAFSRRIQSLEAWAGTDLVDRSSYPTRLTPAGQTLHVVAQQARVGQSVRLAHRVGRDGVVVDEVV